MNEQMRKHLNQLNNVSNDPPLVAVVQYDEGAKEAVLLLGGQTIQDGETVAYKGKQFPVTFKVENLGSVPDEEDYGHVHHYISTEAWDPRAKTIVTTSKPVYATRPGRTVVGATVSLSIGGKPVAPADDGLGSRVICTGDGGPVTLRRWRFIVPNTVWGYREEPKAHRRADIED